MILNSLYELHGKKSKCGKFTVNVDKGFLAVACNFHDGKDRIVYSECLDRTDNILQDLHTVWNFQLYRLVKEEYSTHKSGIIILYNHNGKKVAFYDKNDKKIGFTEPMWFELFYGLDENLELLIDSVIASGGRVEER